MGQYGYFRLVDSQTKNTILHYVLAVFFERASG